MCISCEYQNSDELLIIVNRCVIRLKRMRYFGNQKESPPG